MKEHPTQSASMAITLAMYALAAGLAFATPFIMLKLILIGLVTALTLLLWFTPFVLGRARTILTVVTLIVAAAILGAAFIPLGTDSTSSEGLTPPSPSPSGRAGGECASASTPSGPVSLCASGRSTANTGRVGELVRRVEVGPGSTVQVVVTYRNDSGANQQNVVLRARPPAGVSYIPGSTQMQNANYQFPSPWIAEGLADQGLNIGHYLPNGNAAVIFSVVVSLNHSWQCGEQPAPIVIEESHEGGVVTTTALDLTVRRSC